jgi:hypothetical protein
MTKAVIDLSSADLSAVYQTLQSPELALLKDALQAELRLNPGNSDARAALANLFNLEAVVLRDVSERILSVMEVGDDSLRQGHRFDTKAEEGHDSYKTDISPRNLKTLVETSATANTRLEKTTGSQIQEISTDRIIPGLDSRKIGDTLRGSELTMNVDPTFLFGGDESISGDLWENIFHIADKGITPKGEHYTPFRDEVEQKMFPELTGSPIRANERPSYAALNVGGNLNGTASNYGGCVFVLRPETARRATFTVDDTFVTVPLKIDAARRAALDDALGHLESAQGMPDGVLDALRDPNSPLRKNLAAALARLPEDRQTITLKEFEALVAAGGVKDEIDAFGHDWVRPVLIRVFGDAEANRSRTATFDTLETLLPHLGEVDGAALIHAAATGKGKFALPGRYIEAQLQGSFVPKRDVGEIRMDVGDLLDWKNKCLNRRKLQSLIEFTKANDIKLTLKDLEGVAGQGLWAQEALAQIKKLGFAIITSDEIVASNPETTENKRLLLEPAVKFTQEHQSVAQATAKAREWLKDDALLGEKLLAIAKALPGGADLAAAPLSGAALDRVKARFLEQVDQAIAAARRDGVGINVEETLSRALRAAAEKPLAVKLALLAEVDKLVFDNDGQKAAFRDWAVSARALSGPEELRMIHANSMAQIARMERLGDNPGAVDLAREFGAGLRDLFQSVDQFKIEVNPAEFGPDDLFAEMNRTAFMSAAMLGAKNPELAGRMLAALESPAVRDLRGICGLFHGMQAENLTAKDKPFAASLGDFLNFTADALARQLGRPSLGRTAFPKGLDYAPADLRAALAAAAPLTVAELNDKAPVKTPRILTGFPSPTHSERLPQTQAERRSYHVAMLDAYRRHEETFDGDRGVHGLAHASRTFMFATVMANIMAEKGVAVDMNAVLCGISAHDSGRRANGTDVDEKASAGIGIEAMKARYGPDSLGTD